MFEKFETSLNNFNMKSFVVRPTTPEIEDLQEVA